MLGVGGVVARGALRELDEVEVLHLEPESAGVDARHVQEVVDEGGERLRAVLRLGDELPDLRRVAF